MTIPHPDQPESRKIWMWWGRSEYTQAVGGVLADMFAWSLRLHKKSKTLIASFQRY